MADPKPSLADCHLLQLVKDETELHLACRDEKPGPAWWCEFVRVLASHNDEHQASEKLTISQAEYDVGAEMPDQPSLAEADWHDIALQLCKFHDGCKGALVYAADAGRVDATMDELRRLLASRRLVEVPERPKIVTLNAVLRIQEELIGDSGIAVTEETVALWGWLADVLEASLAAAEGREPPLPAGRTAREMEIMRRDKGEGVEDGS